MINIVPEKLDILLFLAFLHDTFKSENPDEEAQQITLLQEIIGTIILGIMARYQKAALFYDPFGRAGKGTMERIIRSLVPKELISAASPFKWDQEYYIAKLAGKRLNSVGELEASKPIPSAAFKTVTGGDLLTGRRIMRDPFTFINEAAHLFMSNHLIATTDYSAAFFARWLIIHFPNSRLKSDLSIDPDLADRIIQNELAGIAYWAIEGAKRLLENGKFSSSKVHDRLMEKWRLAANSLLEFVSEECVLNSDLHERRAEFYQRYKEWCAENGRKPFAKGKAKELLEHNIGLGIRHTKLNGNEIFRGVGPKDKYPLYAAEQEGGSAV
jgi:putative DNA primase/helicase